MRIYTYVVLGMLAAVLVPSGAFTSPVSQPPRKTTTIDSPLFRHRTTPSEKKSIKRIDSMKGRLSRKLRQSRSVLAMLMACVALSRAPAAASARPTLSTTSNLETSRVASKPAPRFQSSASQTSSAKSNLGTTKSSPASREGLAYIVAESKSTLRATGETLYSEYPVTTCVTGGGTVLYLTRRAVAPKKKRKRRWEAPIPEEVFAEFKTDEELWLENAAKLKAAEPEIEAMITPDVADDADQSNPVDETSPQMLLPPAKTKKKAVEHKPAEYLKPALNGILDFVSANPDLAYATMFSAVTLQQSDNPLLSFIVFGATYLTLR